jgi:tetratricopeptide (TPR) repeat protein
MKMKTKIIFLCAVFIVAQAITYGQKTEVSVQKGTVLAQTAMGEVTVDAGKKAILKQDENPSVTVDEPMVDDIMKIYKWVEAEKEANQLKIEFTSIQVKSIESEDSLTSASLMEIPNKKSEPSNTARIGLTSILNNPEYYDLSGNLLTFDLDKVNERRGYYYLHFPEPVEPGDKFGIISVSQFNLSDREFWKEGPLWKIRLGNCTPNCLNYFRMILPESAIFVDSSRPVAMLDSFQGRVAVTIRNYTGPQADGMYQISFLWPDKDGTTLADLPPQYRGLQDVLTSNLTEEYHKQMEKILAGKVFNDLSSPLSALLTNNCAFVRKDKDLYTNSTYLVWTDPKRIEKVSQMDDKTWDKIRSYFVDELDLLSTPDWPDKPENGYIHPIYMCSKDSKMRADTLACIYENGKWYRFGNMGNARDTDVSVFRKWISKSDDEPGTEKATLDNLPWDNAGPEALEVYQQFVDEDVEYAGKWNTLGIKLVGGDFLEQAFDSFNQCKELLSHKESFEYITSLIWQGHIYDIWQERQQALQKYREALDVVDQYKNNQLDFDIEKVCFVRHDQWGIIINYKWLKERLETPFTREMIGK